MTKLELKWNEFRATLKAGYSQNEAEVLRTAFYAGAITAFAVVNNASMSPGDSGVEEINSLAMELLNFRDKKLASLDASLAKLN